MNRKSRFGLHELHGHRWLLHLFLFASALVYPSFSLFGLGQTSGNDLEARVKAAYIYNFTKFVYWDRGADNAGIGPITIFVLGTDPIGRLLEDFSKKQSSDHPIVVKRMDNELNEISACQLLFVASSEKQKLPAIFKRLQRKNVLTVSDISGFAHHGGMIGFVIEDGRVKIEINLQAANDAGLRISAKLLEIARIISRED